MVILIEAQRIFRKNKHGMDFVILEALKEIQKIDKDNRYYVIVSAGDDKCLESTQNMQVIETKSYPYPIWEQIVLPQYINKINPDIVHCTSNTAPVNCKAPLVLKIGRAHV